MLRIRLRRIRGREKRGQHARLSRLRRARHGTTQHGTARHFRRSGLPARYRTYGGAVPRYRKTLTRYEIPNQPRFLTFSCHQRLALFGNPAIRDAFAEQIAIVQQQSAFQLIAWVIMPEHVHLLIVPDLPDWPISKILRVLKQPFAERVIRRWKRSGAPVLDRLSIKGRCYRFWLQGGGYDRNIETDRASFETVEYIHLNPKKRGLVEWAEQWRWSSARWYAGDHTGPVRVDRLWS